MQSSIHSTRRLIPLLLLIFIDSFSYFVVIPVLLQLFYHHTTGILPADFTQKTRDILTGVAISLSPMATLIAAPFIGNASDKYGRKKTLLGCLLCVTAGFIFLITGIVAKSLCFVLLGRLIAGFGSASQAVAQAAVADCCDQKNKALFLSFIALMMTLALVVGPLAGGYLLDSHLVSSFTVATPCLFALLLSLGNLFLLLFFFHETQSEHGKTSQLRAWQTWIELPICIKRYRFGLLMLIFLFLELGWSQYYQSVPLFLTLKLHYSTQKISLFNAYLGAMMSAGLLFLYPSMLRFFSIGSIMRFCVVFVFLSLIGCVLLATSPWHWFFAGVVSVFTGCAYVSLVALISNKTAQNHQGLVMGYLSTLLFFAWMLTAFDGGWLIADYALLPFCFAAAFFGVGCGVVGWMREK